MVAVINTSPNIKRSLNYNEQKVQRGVAHLIGSSGFLKDTEVLTFYDKCRTFEKLTSLNQRTKLNSVHISLNFDPSEHLATTVLKEIAASYLDRIGFGNQPFLVYQHHDAGHPHIHIVTTNIERTGQRIAMQNIGRNQSEKARKEIEQEFNLVIASDRHKNMHWQLKPVDVQKIQYGKSDTRRAMINVLDRVLTTYRYPSLPELNAVLQLYNILADRGPEKSRTFQSGGLLYSLLDQKGKAIGIPIKASNIYNKPTLKFLQEKFAENLPAKQKYKQRLRNAIDIFFKSNLNPDFEKFKRSLQQEQITLVVRENEQRIIYGLTYVDHKNKTVFNGSDLGKEYSANQVLQKLYSSRQEVDKIDMQQNLNSTALSKLDMHSEGRFQKKTITEKTQKNEGNTIITDILFETESTQGIPSEWYQNAKRKKKKLNR